MPGKRQRAGGRTTVSPCHCVGAGEKSRTPDLRITNSGSHVPGMGCWLLIRSQRPYGTGLEALDRKATSARPRPSTRSARRRSPRRCQRCAAAPWARAYRRWSTGHTRAVRLRSGRPRAPWPKAFRGRRRRSCSERSSSPRLLRSCKPRLRRHGGRRALRCCATPLPRPASENSSRGGMQRTRRTVRNTSGADTPLNDQVPPPHPWLHQRFAPGSRARTVVGLDPWATVQGDP